MMQKIQHLAPLSFNTFWKGFSIHFKAFILQNKNKTGNEEVNKNPKTKAKDRQQH